MTLAALVSAMGLFKTLWPALAALVALAVGGFLGHKITKAAQPKPAPPAAPVVSAQQQAATDAAAVTQTTAQQVMAMDKAAASAPATQAGVVDSLNKGEF